MSSGGLAFGEVEYDALTYHDTYGYHMMIQMGSTSSGLGFSGSLGGGFCMEICTEQRGFSLLAAYESISEF